MPSRQNVVRIASDVVQGEDSYVRLRRMTVGEIKKAFGDPGDERTALESFTASARMYLDHVLEWNWVQDDGSPLPQPNDDPTVADKLTDQELLFLGQSLSGGTDSKN